MRSPQAQMAKMESMMHQIKVSIILQMCVFLVFSFKLYIFIFKSLIHVNLFLFNFLGRIYTMELKLLKAFRTKSRQIMFLFSTHQYSCLGGSLVGIHLYHRSMVLYFFLCFSYEICINYY